MSDAPKAPATAAQDCWDCPSAEWPVDINTSSIAAEAVHYELTLEARLKIAVEKQVEKSLTHHHEVLLAQIRSLMTPTTDVRQESKSASCEIIQHPSIQHPSIQHPGDDIPHIHTSIQHPPQVLSSQKDKCEMIETVEENEHVVQDLSNGKSKKMSHVGSYRAASLSSNALGSEVRGTFSIFAKSISSLVDTIEKGQQSRQEQMVDFVKKNTDGRSSHHSESSPSLQTLMLQYKAGDEISRSPPKSRLQSCLLSPLFNFFIGILVCSNAVFIGSEVNYLATHPDKATVPMSFQVISYSYTCVFLLELVLRMIGDRHGFLWASETTQLMWNYLDIFIVMSSLVEIGLDVLARSAIGDASGGANVGNVQTIRLVRIFRLLRLIRMARFVRFIRSLRMMVYSILCTLRHVFWAMVLLAFIMYVFAILFTSATTSYKTKKFTNDNMLLIPGLEERWGSLHASMLSLFMSIASGISWVEVIEPLNRLDTVWTYFFLVYLSFTYFAVLNVVTGVFCQAAVQSSNEDQEAMLQTFLRHKRMYTERFMEIFASLDDDASGTITLDEYLEQMHHEDVRNYFASLGLESVDALCIFDLFEDAGTHGVKVEEFVMGCLRLKGFARSSDMLKLLHEHRQLFEQIEKIIEHLNLSPVKKNLSQQAGVMSIVQSYADGVKQFRSQNTQDVGRECSFASLAQRTISGYIS